MAESKIKLNHQLGFQVTPTYNASLCDTGNVYAERSGNIFRLSGWIKPKSGAFSSKTNVLVSELPKPVVNTIVIFYDNSDGTLGAFFISGGGTTMTVSEAKSTHEGHILDLYATYIIRDV